MKTRSFSKYILIVVIALAAGVMYSMFLKSGDKTDNGRQRLGKNATATVEKGEIIQRSTIAGAVIPNRKTVITAPYKGYIKKIYVHLGQTVKAGDPIASVSPTLVGGETVFPLRSPFAGKVVQLNKAEGEYVKESDPEDFIARVDDVSKLFIDANVPELDRVKMLTGLEAVVKASAILDRTYKAVVRELTLAAREKDRYGRSTAVEFPMKLEITDFDEQLHPGMSVIVDIITLKKENVLLLRHEFIGRDKSSYFVTLQNGNRQKIKLGAQNEEHAEVIEGLTAGAIVQKVDFSLSQDQ